MYKRAVKILHARIGIVFNNEALINEPRYFEGQVMESLLTNIHSIEKIPYADDLDAHFVIIDVPHIHPDVRVTDRARHRLGRLQPVRKGVLRQPVLAVRKPGSSLQDPAGRARAPAQHLDFPRQLHVQPVPQNASPSGGRRRGREDRFPPERSGGRLADFQHGDDPPGIFPGRPGLSHGVALRQYPPRQSDLRFSRGERPPGSEASRCGRRLGPQDRHRHAAYRRRAEVREPPDSGDRRQDRIRTRKADRENRFPQGNDGEQRLSNGSFIVTSTSTRQEILVFTDTAVYSMQYVGPPFVWSFNLMDQDVSIASQNAVVAVNNAVYWMGEDKFFMYDGRVQTLPCTRRQHVFSNLNRSQILQVMCGINEPYSEVWWFYPGTDSQVNSLYVEFNYQDGTWHYGSLNRTAYVQQTLRTYPMLAKGVQTSYLSSLQVA